LARRLEFHYTPKHGSWLNIAEIELAVLSNICLSQRIPDKETIRREIEANVRERNLKAKPVGASRIKTLGVNRLDSIQPFRHH
jgi:hypothetical protein